MCVAITARSMPRAAALRRGRLRITHYQPMRVPRRPCTSGSRGVDRWSASPSRQADTCISVVRGSVTASLHVVRLRVMRHRGGTSTGGRSETPTRTVRPESRPGAHAPEDNETCRQRTSWHLSDVAIASRVAVRTSCHQPNGKYSKSPGPSVTLTVRIVGGLRHDRRSRLTSDSSLATYCWLLRTHLSHGR